MFEALAEGGDFGGFFLSEVSFLKGVIDEVIELRVAVGVFGVAGGSAIIGFTVVFRVVNEELPVATDKVEGFEVRGAVLEVEDVVVSIKTEDGVSFGQGFSVLERDAFHGPGNVKIEGFENGGGDVDGGNEGVFIDQGRDFTRPSEHDGRADAPFMGVLFREGGEGSGVW